MRCENYVIYDLYTVLTIVKTSASFSSALNSYGGCSVTIATEMFANYRTIHRQN